MEEKTPLMQQYADIKKQYNDTLVLFQVGDFYELFYDDAIRATQVLGITLTAKGKSKNGESIPLCGVPVHTAEFYIKKLLEQGFKIALCNQQGEARPGVIVQRRVEHVFTPGTLVDLSLLKEKKISYLLSVAEVGDLFGLAVVELITGSILCTLIDRKNKGLFQSELARFSPDEIIISDESKETIDFLKKQNFFVSTHRYESINIRPWLEKQKIDCIGRCITERALYQAIEQLYSYLRYANQKSLEQIYDIAYYTPEEYLIVDANTQLNLEVFSSGQEKKHSLFHVLDNCVTPMGSRMLKKWLNFPLKQRHAIERRLRVVDYFFQKYGEMNSVRAILKHVGDFERIIGRIALDRATITDYRSIANSIAHMSIFFNVIKNPCEQELIVPLLRLLQCHDLEKLRALLIAALHEDYVSGCIMKDGYDKKLDELRSITNDVRKNIIALEASEQQKTGISTLKIRQSNLHGYFIEVTASHLHKIPSSYRRLQSLSGKERYTNDALEELEKKVESATKNLFILEQELFVHIKQEVVQYLPLLRQLAFLFSYFDGITTHAFNAHQYSYVVPKLNEEGVISIASGRHPVVERIIKQRFIPNTVVLDDNNFLIVLTGPNMGGKSTYLRQVALIALMAHIGSFVPAKLANIMVLDRIFTRIGAGDNLAEGKSTFLVEMEEVATICHNATTKSLVVLDEVGRGTSTDDGIAIAQAVIEYLYLKKSRCLFATHYKELAQLEKTHAKIASYCVASKKENENIVFLYTVIPGIAQQSFGVEVAKIAQLPPEVIKRVIQLLQQEKQYSQQSEARMQEKIERLEHTLKMSEKKYKMLDDVNLDTITPKQALDILFQLRKFER